MNDQQLERANALKKIISEGQLIIDACRTEPDNTDESHQFIVDLFQPYIVVIKNGESMLPDGESLPLGDVIATVDINAELADEIKKMIATHFLTITGNAQSEYFNL